LTKFQEGKWLVIFVLQWGELWISRFVLLNRIEIEIVSKVSLAVSTAAISQTSHWIYENEMLVGPIQHIGGCDKWMCSCCGYPWNFGTNLNRCHYLCNRPGLMWTQISGSSRGN
jgi:hypothetical protein